MGRWEEVQHTADLAVHIWGDSLRDLFTTAAAGMFALMVEVGSAVVSETCISLEAPDVEGLLVDWLSELLYLSERDGAAFTAASFATLTETALAAEVTGYAILQPRAHIHIKAVTYHMLRVDHDDRGYETEIVFDV